MTFRLGLDIDETITAYPEFFAVLTDSLIKNGHEVYIITGTEEEYEPLRKEFIENMGIKYTKFISTNGEPKLSYAQAHDIDLVIDDIPKTYNLLYSNVPFKFIRIEK